MPKPKTARANPALRLGLIRQLHVYVSVFVAPSLLFFAITGALQTFRIPDQKTAPVVLQRLARLHKDDVFAVKPPRPKRAESHGEGGHEKAGHDQKAGPDDKGPQSAKAGPEKPPEASPQPKPSTEVMKYFFALVSIGIAVTTLLGLWMALAHGRRKIVIWALLIAGILAPVIIAAL